MYISNAKRALCLTCAEGLRRACCTGPLPFLKFGLGSRDVREGGHRQIKKAHSRRGGARVPRSARAVSSCGLWFRPLSQRSGKWDPEIRFPTYCFISNIAHPPAPPPRVIAIAKSERNSGSWSLTEAGIDGSRGQGECA